MKLAIKGHETRGAEVIEILKMLGGTNPFNYSADSDGLCFYIGKGINDTNVIYYDWIRYCYDDEEWIVFTLEEFLEKFPYKVGDKVQFKGVTSLGPVYEIEQIKWEYDQVVYIICDLYWKNIKCTVTTENLQPYKEETMGDSIIDTVKESEGRYRIVLNPQFNMEVDEGEYYAVRRKPQYPKTYKECCGVLKIPKNEHYIDIDAPLVPSDYNRLVSAFTKLLICRDAYWKIAGEQMGLGKPWKPDWNNGDQERYGIIKLDDNGYQYAESTSFVFPTKEMRNAFLENFEELIENVKELL